ncbi:MAG: lipid-binding SYLF domain-containing protein, partial [Vicinamibacterales bacterium]
MKRTARPATVALLLAVTAIVNPLVAQQSPENEVRRVTEATTVLEEIMAAADKSVPRAIIEKAEGIAVFPSMIKGGLVVGAQHGRGILSVRNKQTGGWSSPAFLSITGG